MKRCDSNVYILLYKLKHFATEISSPVRFVYRKKKQVTVNGTMIVPYDHLVLSTGQQYQVPAPTEADISQKVSTEDVVHDPERPYRGVVPQNLYLVNDSFDAAVALYKADTEVKPDSRNL